jgi:hypothetical protein
MRFRGDEDEIQARVSSTAEAKEPGLPLIAFV